MKYSFSNYKMAKLGCYTQILPGHAFKSQNFTDDPSGIALVKGENVQQGRIDWADSKYWPVHDVDSYSNFKLRYGDIVVAMDRPWVKAGLKWAHIYKHDPPALLVQRVARLRAKPGLNQTYLRCLISSRYFEAYIQPIVTGVNVPHISGPQIAACLVPLPDCHIQLKIAALISTYDELIENNRQRIALLEKMAEEIYREWFVRFRFPKAKRTDIVKGVPLGWRIDSIDSLGKVVTGKTPSTSNPRLFGDEYPFIKTPDMHENMFITDTEQLLTQDGLESQSSQTIPRGSICVSCIGTGGIVSITTQTSQTNQQINSVILREQSELEWAFFTLRNLRETIQLFGATGTTMTNLSKGKFASLKILYPDSETLSEFHALAKPLFEQIQNIGGQIKMLQSSRDMLLPRLISGKLSVEDLDIQFPPSMKEETKAEEPETVHA